MANNGTIIEAMSFCAGVNTHPALMSFEERVAYLSNAVNRSVYRGFNETRPPLREVMLKFETTEDEYIFRNAAISGFFFYEGETSLFSSFLIVAVGDRIFAGYIRGSSLEFIRIYKGIDPRWHHAFFCQALNILTYNDGKNPGLYWTGDPAFPMKPIYQSAYIKDERPMPISNISVFAFGRIFPATPSNLVYASDYIYSQATSIQAREAVLSFSETAYPTSGDGFGAPSAMGPITGMVTVPQSNTLNGYGDLMVLCRNGVWSISPNRKQRNEWTADTEMQKHVFKGKGCASPHSITTFNNQILYRDNNTGISSLNLDIANYQRSQAFTPISIAIDRYTDYDANSDDIQYTTSMATDRRVLFSVSHRKEFSSEMGVHRYGMGLVSACVQENPRGNIFSWEGLWTGVRPVGMATANIGNVKQFYIASHDHDGQNRIYLFDERATGNDAPLQREKRIQGKFSFGSIFSGLGSQSPITKRTFRKAEAFLINSSNPTLSFNYNIDGDTLKRILPVQLTETAGCGNASYNGLTNDSEDGSNTGYFFDMNFETIGVCGIGKVCFSAVEKNEAGYEQPGCNVRSSPGFDICKLNESDRINNNFEYQIYGK